MLNDSKICFCLIFYVHDCSSSCNGITEQLDQQSIKNVVRIHERCENKSLPGKNFNHVSLVVERQSPMEGRMQFSIRNFGQYFQTLSAASQSTDSVLKINSTVTYRLHTALEIKASKRCKIKDTSTGKQVYNGLNLLRCRVPFIRSYIRSFIHLSILLARENFQRYRLQINFIRYIYKKLNPRIAKKLRNSSTGKTQLKRWLVLIKETLSILLLCSHLIPLSH